MRLDIKSSYHKEKIFVLLWYMLTGCCDFTIHTNNESLCCIPETNTMLRVNCISVKKTEVNRGSSWVIWQVIRIFGSSFLLSG